MHALGQPPKETTVPDRVREPNTEQELKQGVVSMARRNTRPKFLSAGVSMAKFVRVP